MESQNTQSEGLHPSAVTDPVKASCRKKKSKSASFLEDIREHFEEFVHASTDEHITCFKKTMQKMFEMSKVVAERTSGAKEIKEVESSLPLQSTVSQ